MEKYFEIGQVISVHGIRGFMKVKPFTDNIKNFKNFKKIFIEEGKELKEFQVEEVKFIKEFALIKLEGIDTIEEAEKYRNFYLKIERKDANKLDKDSYYIVDLIGSKVYSVQNDYLGILEEIFSTGSNDVYVVKDDLGKQILLPAIKEVIKSIDPENKKIIVNIIEGLL